MSLTISDSEPRRQYTGNGVQTAFSANFEFRAASDVVCNVDGVVKTLNTDYTLTGAGVSGGGTLTFSVAPANGAIITIYRDMPIARTADQYASYGQIPAEVLEQDLDDITMKMQQLEVLLGRASRVSMVEAVTSSAMEWPEKTSRLGKYARWNSSTGALEAASELTAGTTLSQSTIGAALYPRTAAEISAGVTPSAYYYQPGEQQRGDIRRYGVTTASSASAVASAVQSALAAHGYAFIPAGDWNWNPVLFTGTRQRIYGDGLRTQLILNGAITGIDFDGYAGCEVSDLVMYSTNSSAVGIDIGPNAGASRFAHWWRLKRVMVIGNTPNWATTSLATTRAGLTDGIRVQTAFYGHAEQCEVSYSNGNGFRLYDRANGNTFTGCHARDNAVGVKIEGTGGGNSNGNVWQGGNIEASITGSIGIDLGEADRNRFSGRMEVSATSGIHVRVNPPSSTLAQENVFDLELTGTSVGYQLGDGSGTSQVKGTIIRGGKVGSTVTINSDCLQTRLEVAPSGFAGVTLTDSGYGTILHADVGGGHWYERPSNQNTSAYNHDLTVGTGSSDESLGDNSKTISFTSMSSAFTFEKVNAGGTNLSVLRFGAYRFWVSPTDGKAYIKGSTPTTHSDGTVVGTQT